MQIERTHHIDSSEPDKDGMFDYYYEYDIYRFTDRNVSLVVRSYTDEPDEAQFLRIEINGTSRELVDDDLKLPIFLSALSHVRTEGKMHLSWLSGRGNGYEPVPHLA